ncbi:MAG TPA: thioredoxin family protein [Steroidobacteraceae bacterium]|jgi:protein disulfide-isomerase|nr:thioredoxin family protein [Steroidobacteraceae bacterium]
MHVRALYLPGLMCLSLLLAAGCHPPHEPQSGPTPPRSGSAALPRPAPAASVSPIVSAPAAPAALPGATGIAWFHGSLEQAFAAAQREHRPVLLFWGAQWCPFCHTLKATVFRRPDFIAETRLFVPVYLDGDDPGAQQWGERFGVRGYPTLVLLDSDRREIMRLGAGRDVSQYAAVLSLALAQLQPIDGLLQSAAAGHELSAEGCRRLASNAWDLDTPEPSRYGELADQLQAAARACPAGAAVERASLTIYAAGYAADAADAASTGAADAPTRHRTLSPQLVALTDEVSAILAQPRLARASVVALQNLDTSFFHAVRARGPRIATRLRDRYVATMDAAAADPQYVQADQLGFVDAKILALTSIGGPAFKLPPTVLTAADRRIDAALTTEQDAYVRPGLVNAALGILEDSGQYQRAYRIAQAEIGRSDAPYYYQADLAEIAEKLGRKQEAIQLYGEAYQGARGPATRFQWGQLYLSALLRLAPQDATRIQSVGLQVLGELDGPARLADRARGRLAQLDGELRAWNAAAHGRHQEVLRALRAHLQPVCVQMAPLAPARAGCDAFLRRAA